MPARASPSGFTVPITFQFHSLVVSCSDIVQERVFMWDIPHLALKGLISFQILVTKSKMNIPFPFS